MLTTAKRDRASKKFITSGHSYDILQNVYYTHPLQYEKVLDRDDERPRSDFMIPHDPQTQSHWILCDAVRTALSHNENIELPKSFDRDRKQVNTA